MVAPQARGQGAATEMLRWLTDWALEELGARRLRQTRFTFPLLYSGNVNEIGGRWSQPDSNRRPLRCKRSALPTELWPQAPDCRPEPGRYGARPVPTSFAHSSPLGATLSVSLVPFFAVFAVSSNLPSSSVLVRIRI